MLNEKEVVLMKPDLFGEKKPLSLVEISYCILNETKLQPIKRFLQFLNDRYAITVTCLTKKTKPHLPGLHKSCSRLQPYT